MASTGLCKRCAASEPSSALVLNACVRQLEYQALETLYAAATPVTTSS
jgi:hypothetical protein